MNIIFRAAQPHEQARFCLSYLQGLGPHDRVTDLLDRFNTDQICFCFPPDTVHNDIERKTTVQA